jgi:hypothetical protein
MTGVVLNLEASTSTDPPKATNSLMFGPNFKMHLELSSGLRPPGPFSRSQFLDALLELFCTFDFGRRVSTLGGCAGSVGAASAAGSSGALVEVRALPALQIRAVPSLVLARFGPRA